MRKVVRRGLALSGALCVTAISSAALAEPTLHVAPKTAAAKQAKVSDFESPARRALAHVRTSLVATSTDRFGDGDAIVHFEQTHRGLPVIGRGAAVRLGSDGREIITAVDVEEDLPSTSPTVVPSAAASIAARFAPGVIAESDAHLVIWPKLGGGSRLAYVVLPRIPAGIPLAPRVVVDAQTGKVIESRDLIRYAKATVYQFNPTKTPQLASFDLALTPGAKLTNEFLTSTNCVDKKTVKPLNLGGFAAKMHVCDLEQLATADVEGNFVYAPSDTAGAMTSRSDEFSEVSMYYHTAKAYDFFRTLQGVPDAKVVNDKPLRVVANLQIPAGISSGNIVAASNPDTPLETFSNAFFSPAGGGLGAIFQQLYGFKDGGLWFGQGPQRDYAYDGDVVYHEFSHAVVDATLKLEAWHVDARGAIDSPGAMNEGLADYFSSAITGDPDVGEYASKDISQNSGVIRTLANQDKCPTNIIGEVHFDSTLFSGALWEARSALPTGDRSKMDAALYKAMRTNPGRGDLGYDDLGKLFLATLGTDLPAGATALDTALKARGILPSCERIFELKDGSVKAIEPLAGGFAAPGLQSIPGGDLAPGLIQVHVKAAETDATVTVSVTAKSGSAAPANPLAGDATPFAPVALVKFGKAITWKASGGTVDHDADTKAELSTGARRSATFDVPAGTTDIYVQIANKGDSDGAYDDVKVELAPAAVEPPAADPPAGDPPAAPTESVSGCACSTPATSTNTLPIGGLLAALGLAVAALRRRRA